MSVVQLTPLTHITPTMVSRINACPFQVACDRDRAIQGMIVKGTAARLGTICHCVLEAIGKRAIAPTADWDAAFDVLWSQEAARMEAEIERSPRDRHVGSPARWPHYAMRRAWVKHIAHELWMRQREPAAAREPGAAVLFERSYEAFGGRMKGTADVVRQVGGELVIEDYKSGPIMETGGEGHIPAVRESYRHQVLLYAAMHHDTTGVWPSRGRLIPLGGEPLDIVISPQEGSALADAALALLDSYNAAIRAGAQPSDLARPSEETCKWCGYHGVCDAVWEAMSPKWTWPRYAIEGVVLAAQPISRGLTNADVHVERGSVSAGTYRVQTDIPACADALLRARQQRARITNLRYVAGRLITTSASGVWPLSQDGDAVAP